MSECAQFLAGRTTAASRAFLLFGLFLGFGAPASMALESDPVVFLKSTNQQLLEEVNGKRADIEADVGVAREIVRRVLTPKMDLERTSRWVLGKAWRRADEAQRTRFIHEFRTLLVRTYASALTQITDVNLEYLPLEEPDSEANDVTVRTQISAEDSADPISIIYRMYRGSDGWKVYDVTVDGVSLVTTYRASFAHMVKTDGMEALIDAIAEKNRGATS